jgi:putative Mn2+ efflux pump MntP
VSFAFLTLSVHVSIAFLMIGITTFSLSVLGVLIGSSFGARLRARAEMAGGVILVLIGLKILLEHLLG